MKILELPIGRPFRLAGLPEKTGVLLGLGECSASVRYDTAHVKHLAFANGHSFTATRHEPTTISLNTEVEPI